MNFPDPSILEYSEKHSTPEPEALAELSRQTHLQMLLPQMLSGHIQGGLLRMISYMVQPKLAMDIGTFTGYSAICMAHGLAQGGKVHTMDVNDEVTPLATEYFKKSGMQDRIEFHLGDAGDIIPSIPGEIDLVFIDADKINYAKYFDLVIDRIRPGGFILSDNVLWSGKVLEPAQDKDTQAIHEYNNKVNDDPRVENLLLPVRDGLMIARKIG